MPKDSTSIDYNRISPIYDTSRVANAETIEKLIRVLHVDCDSVILDMGCGTGNYTAALQQVTRGVIGIDVSSGMIEQARVKFPALHFICGDVTRLPFGSQTFGAAFAVQVLHHVKEKKLFITEAYRVVRKGAWIAIHACSHQQMRAFWFYHYFSKGLEVDLARMPDSGDIASLLRRAGFSDIGIEICYSDVVVANETPQRYLDKNYRGSISTFAFLSEEDVELGCKKIQEDITSGAAESIVQQSEAKVANETGGSSIVYGLKKDF